MAIQKLNFPILQQLSSNTTANHGTIASSNNECVNAINVYLDNYKEYLLNTSVFECSSLLISENNWFARKGITSCIYKDQVFSLQAGQIVHVDNGKNYDTECGLIHYSLILKVLDKKVLILPMTTNRDEFDKAYHPTTNFTGNFEYRRGLIGEGFSTEVTLFINDIKCVSVGRIIPKPYSDIIDLEVLRSIKEHVSRLMFSDIHDSARESKSITTDILSNM